MEKRKRITYLDMAKGVGIVLMVAGHLFGSLQNIDYKPFFSPAYQFIASFHMPLFFLISGILLGITGEEKKDMAVLVKRKAKTLLLPYATFSLIYMVMNVFGMIFYPEQIEGAFVLKLLVYSVTFHGISVLWFLPALFLGEILFLYFRKRLSTKKLTVLFCLTGAVMFAVSGIFRWPGFDQGNLLLTAAGALLQTAARGLLVCTFLLFGYLFQKLLKEREKKSFLEFGAGLLLFLTGLFLCFKNEVVDLNYMVFGNVAIYLYCACAESFGVILMCKNMPQIKLLIFYGFHSLIIMATHMEFKIMMHAIQFSYWLNQFVTRAKTWVLFATIAVYITLAEVVVIYLYQHYFYFLIGKEKPVRHLKEEKKHE